MVVKIKALNTKPPAQSAEKTYRHAPQARVLIIEGRFYDAISDELANGAIAALDAQGVGLRPHHGAGRARDPAGAGAGGVRGAHPAQRRKRRWDGAVALGCVIRGETSHYDIVCNNANHWLMEVAIRHCHSGRQWHPHRRYRGAGHGARPRRRRRQGRRRGARVPARHRARAHVREAGSMSGNEHEHTPGHGKRRCSRAPRRASRPCRRSTRWTWPAPTSTR